MSARKSAAKERAPERPLADRLRHVFADEIGQLDRIGRDLHETRERVRMAARQREEASAEEAEIKAEIDALPLKLSGAQLADDKEEEARLRERHDSLRARLRDATERREEAERVLDGTDPALAESRAHQKAFGAVTALMRQASERRKELRAALAEGCSDFEDRAGRLLAYGKVSTFPKEG